jgi:hypothetical protein
MISQYFTGAGIVPLFFSTWQSQNDMNQHKEITDESTI